MDKRRKKPDRDADPVSRDGALVLTFVNQGSRRSPRLKDYADLLRWAERYGDLGSAETRRLEQLAAERPEDAAEAFAAAEKLHDFLSRIVNAAVDRKRPPSPAVASLNELLARTAPRRILVPAGIRLKWDWSEDREKDFYLPLRAVALSAMELLTSGDCAKVKRCAAESCDVLFLANGGGMPRKWCSAKSCGDPERYQRYYRRVIKPRNDAYHRQHSH